MISEAAQATHRGEACLVSVKAVKDTLYVLSGKWKLPLILALSNGALRFKEVQRALGEVTPKILSKELRELEINGFVERRVLSTKPVTVLYVATPYSRTLDKVLDEMRSWGLQHRQRIMGQPSPSATSPTLKVLC